MSRRALIGTVLAVVAVHLSVFWLVADWHVLPKRQYIPPPPPPNFAAAESVTVDPATGEKTVRREFDVSTKLSPEKN